MSLDCLYNSVHLVPQAAQNTHAHPEFEGAQVLDSLLLHQPSDLQRSVNSSHVLASQLAYSGSLFMSCWKLRSMQPDSGSLSASEGAHAPC